MQHFKILLLSGTLEIMSKHSQNMQHFKILLLLDTIKDYEQSFTKYEAL